MYSKDRARESQELFEAYVRQRLLDQFDAVQVVSVESQPGEVCQDLDRQANIDCYVVQGNGTLVGISCRIVQHKDYHNFAAKTRELAQWRKQQADPDCMRPAYFCQAFCPDGKFSSMALIRISDLLAGIEELGNCSIVPTAQGDKCYCLVSWEQLKQIRNFKIWQSN